MFIFEVVMKFAIPPGQEPQLFSRYQDLLSEPALKYLSKSCYGIIRKSILSLMPVDEVGKEFSPMTGRPTKELYSISGLLLMKEYFGWSDEETVMNYMTDLRVQYALNIECDRIELSERTLFRYLSIFRKKDLAQQIMDDITEKLIKDLNIEIKDQRLDSTHVFSSMAAWSRKKLMFNVIQRFLKQVKRHIQEEYYRLDKALRERYEHNSGWIFASTTEMGCRGKNFTTEEQMGNDMQRLIDELHSNSLICGMTTYKVMVRVLGEQFIDDRAYKKLNPHPGGKVLVNPSDPDAEIGAKGVGYQVQVAETCGKDNPVQLVTTVLPQGGSASDMKSLPDVVDKMEKNHVLPETLRADQGYGSDGNALKCKSEGIDAVIPAPPKPTGKVGIDECKFDDDNRMSECPAGNHPMFREYKAGRGRAVFHKNVCEKCPLRDKCRSQKRGKQNYIFQYTDADLRTRLRRQKEATPEFKKNYSARCGIEPLFGRLKQWTPLRRLRIRGKESVHFSIYMIFAMHNIMQAARILKFGPLKSEAAAFLNRFIQILAVFWKNTDSAISAKPVFCEFLDFAA